MTNEIELPWTYREMISSGLSRRAANCLIAEGITTRAHARKLGDAGLTRIPNLGMKTLTEIRIWADMPTPLTRRIDRAIELLEQNGYTVSKGSNNE